MIEDVVITPLKQFQDERGKVMHMLRSDWDIYSGFGEIYFSCVSHGKVKAWKKHSRMTLNLACVHGKARLVMFDDRKPGAEGVLQIVDFGEDNYCLVTIPPGIWTGFAARETDAMLANCATILHDPAESTNLSYDDSRIPYDWGGYVHA